MGTYLTQSHFWRKPCATSAHHKNPGSVQAVCGPACPLPDQNSAHAYKARAPGRCTRLVVASPIVVWGLGSGAHLLKLASTGRPLVVLALDLGPDAGSEGLARVAAQPTLQAAMDQGHLELVIGDASTLAQRFQSVEHQCAGPPEIHVHLPAIEMAPPSHQALARIVERTHLEHRRVRALKDTIVANLDANLRTLAASPGIDQLRDCAKGRPGWVLAAGPSLATGLRCVHALKGSGPIIAVDTAWRLCCEQRLDVELVCSVDPNPESARHVELPAWGEHRPALAFQPYADPKVVAAFDTHYAAMPLGDRLAEVTSEALGLPLVHTAGTVLVYALQLATVLGCDPIVMVGADFAHVDGLTHARGTASALPSEATDYVARRADGSKVATTRALRGFQREVEDLVRRLQQEEPDRRVWALDGGGATIRGCAMLDAEALHARLGALRAPPYRLQPPPAIGEVDQVLHRAALKNAKDHLSS